MLIEDRVLCKGNLICESLLNILFIVYIVEKFLMKGWKIIINVIILVSYLLM